MTLSFPSSASSSSSSSSSSSFSSSDAISAAHIHTVHHLIEKCLMFHMDREECVESLEAHANVKPAVTRIVWNELEKANSEFFHAYNKRRRSMQSGRGSQSSSQNNNNNDNFVDENSSIIREAIRDVLDHKK